MNAVTMAWRIARESDWDASGFTIQDSPTRAYNFSEKRLTLPDSYFLTTG
jgi:hypothetical protein